MAQQILVCSANELNAGKNLASFSGAAHFWFSNYGPSISMKCMTFRMQHDLVEEAVSAETFKRDGNFCDTPLNNKTSIGRIGLSTKPFSLPHKNLTIFANRKY